MYKFIRRKSPCYHHRAFEDWFAKRTLTYTIYIMLVIDVYIFVYSICGVVIIMVYEIYTAIYYSIIIIYIYVFILIY